MNTLQDILENTTINLWADHFQRSPEQVNDRHHSDAELIPLPGDAENYLAATIDTVSEEITLGLYREPYTMGWVSIMASLSDLAAVGATPLGMLIAVSMRPACKRGFVDQVARGMEDACRSQGVFILGGDTNEAPVTALTGCALGLVPRKSALSRIGCCPGDVVFTTGVAGMGNALGLARLAGLAESIFPESLYRPVAALRQGQILREHSSCCMDTSDGVLTTLDQLMRLNGVGFEIDGNWSHILAEPVRALCRRTDTPEWMMLAGPHGEFTLIATVPPERARSVEEAFAAQGLPLLRLGTVCETRELRLLLPSGRTIVAEMAPLRNLFQTVKGDLPKYLHEFRAAGKRWGIENHG